MKQPTKTKTIKRWGAYCEVCKNLVPNFYGRKENAIVTCAHDRDNPYDYQRVPVRLTITYTVPKGKKK